MTLLDDSVTQDKDRTWRFTCPVTVGCGLQDGPGFSSSGWPTEDIAKARGKQHFDEHKGIGVVQPLEKFREEQGLAVSTEGVVTVADLP